MRNLLFPLMLMLGLGSVAGHAEESATASDKLLSALSQLTHLQGDFVQQQKGEGGEDLGQASGRFKLLRPGYFSWEILDPDQQLVIADPEFIWHYDRDLETVSRRPVGNDASLSPLQVLGGDAAALRDNYAVESTGEGVFILRPLAAEAGFIQASIELNDGEIRQLVINDSLGQRVSVVFSALDSDSPLTAQDFAFTPPDGVDLFYHDQ